MLASIPFYSSLLGRNLTDKKKAGKVHVLLYGAIETHAMGPKGCIAGNTDLASTTGVAETEVRRYLSEMKQAGWITYEVDKANKRGRVYPLLEIALPLRNYSATLAEKTTAPLRNNSAASIDNIRDDSRENTSDGGTPSADEETQDIILCPHLHKTTGILCGRKAMVKSTYCAHHAVQEIIDRFKDVNESYLEFYGNKTQHAAVKKLIKTYPKEEIDWMIKTAKNYNKMAYRASGDKIYSPYDLLKKWSVMKDNLIKYKLEVKQKEQPAGKTVGVI